MRNIDIAEVLLHKRILPDLVSGGALEARPVFRNIRSQPVNECIVQSELKNKFS